jgi:hypothetical protein
MILIIGEMNTAFQYATQAGLSLAEYRVVHVANAAKFLPGLSPNGMVIVYVKGAGAVLKQPSVRNNVSLMISMGAGELVVSA